VPKVNVSATTEIAVSATQAHDALSNFETWPIWSPWLYIEPNTKVTYRGQPGEAGHGYDWLGEKTGEGQMTLLQTTGQKIECDLQFIKPFKSMPIFMFWMKETMSGMIKTDYKRGLAMLKDYLESGSIRSSTTIYDVVDVDETYYVGSCGSSTLDDIGPTMDLSFQSLADATLAGHFSANDSPLCFYESMDIKTHRCEYTAALPTSHSTTVDAPLVSALRPKCSALKVIHVGPYRHLGNAWSVIMAEAKARKLKILKSQVPFERYVNNPDEVQEDELITEIYLPVRTV